MDRIKKISRREFIKISAIAGGLGVGGKLLWDITGKGFVMVKETRLLMGTIINLSVLAESQSAGEQAVAATFGELERQIAIFDHRTAGTPAGTLNSTGVLANPPAEFVDVLEQANEISELTGGAFDVTVQPLVALYQQSQPGLPDKLAVEAALAMVDYRKVSISSAEISFAQPGMAITLDGIAKGYIVDAGAEQLRKLGYDNIFVEAGGDLMASGVKENGVPWRVGMQSPRSSQSEIVGSFSVSNQAVATSGDYINYYSADMVNHHILDPRRGISPADLASASVIAPSTVLADCLATALMVLEPQVGMSLVERLPGVEAMTISKSMEETRSSGFPQQG